MARRERRLADAAPLGTSKALPDVRLAVFSRLTVPPLKSNSLADAPPLGSTRRSDAASLTTSHAPGNSAAVIPSGPAAASVRARSRWGELKPADGEQDADQQPGQPDAATQIRTVTPEVPRRTLSVQGPGKPAARPSVRRPEGSVAAEAAMGQTGKRKQGEEKPSLPQLDVSAGDAAERGVAAAGGKLSAAARPREGLPPAREHLHSHTLSRPNSAAVPSRSAAQHASVGAPVQKKRLRSTPTVADREAAAAVSAGLDAILPSIALLPSPLLRDVVAAVSSAETTRPSTVRAAANDDLPPHMQPSGGRRRATGQQEALSPRVPSVTVAAAPRADSIADAHAAAAGPAQQGRVAVQKSAPAATISKGSARHARSHPAAKLPAQARPASVVAVGAAAERTAVRPAGRAVQQPATAAPLAAAQPNPVVAAGKGSAGTRSAATHAQRYVPTGRPDQTLPPARAPAARIVGLQTAARPAASRVLLRETAPPAADPNLIITFESSDEEEGQDGVPVPASPAEAALHRAAQAAEAAGAPFARPAGAADDALARQMAELRAAIAARERKAAQREREAAATAFLDSLSLPQPVPAPTVFQASLASASTAPAAEVVTLTRAEAPEAADDQTSAAEVVQITSALPRSSTASPAQSGSSRRSSLARKHVSAVPDPSAFQRAGSGVIFGVEIEDRLLVAADANPVNAAQEQLLAELAVIQVRHHQHCSEEEGAERIALTVSSCVASSAVVEPLALFPFMFSYDPEVVIPRRPTGRRCSCAGSC